MFRTFTSKFTCPALTSQSAGQPIPSGSGTLVSVGFQNIGSAQLFYTSQIFPVTTTKGFCQVINNSFTSTDWLMYLVVFFPDEASASKAGALPAAEVSEASVAKS